MSLSRDPVRARYLTAAQRRLVFEALVWLGLLRVATAALPHRRVASLLRLTASDPTAVSLPSPAERGSGGDPHDAGEGIGWAVRAAAARTPWLSTCLVQSLAGSAMLRRHHLQGVVYLGVARDAGGEFIAHSWLRSGDRILTGAGDHDRYSVIAAYQPAPDRHR